MWEEGVLDHCLARAKLERARAGEDVDARSRARADGDARERRHRNATRRSLRRAALVLPLQRRAVAPRVAQRGGGEHGGEVDIAAIARRERARGVRPGKDVQRAALRVDVVERDPYGARTLHGESAAHRVGRRVGTVAVVLVPRHCVRAVRWLDDDVREVEVERRPAVRANSVEDVRVRREAANPPLPALVEVEEAPRVACERGTPHDRVDAPRRVVKARAREERVEDVHPALREAAVLRRRVRQPASDRVRFAQRPRVRLVARYPVMRRKAHAVRRLRSYACVVQQQGGDSSVPALLRLVQRRASFCVGPQRSSRAAAEKDRAHFEVAVARRAVQRCAAHPVNVVHIHRAAAREERGHRDNICCARRRDQLLSFVFLHWFPQNCRSAKKTSIGSADLQMLEPRL